MDGVETGFTDKQGKHARLVNADEPPGASGGYKLSQRHSELSVVLDHQHKPFI